jgi:hypothetical protein
MGKRIFVVLGLICLLALSWGCTHSQKLRAIGGQEADCKVFYWGIIGAGMAYRMVEDCAQRMEKQGYVRIKETPGK